jgi:uncharacterized peroxidase-related enzyme
MPHIELSPQIPGIVSLFAFRPATAHPLSLLAETLLRPPASDNDSGALTRGERELIAALVSTLNNCEFCSESHAAFARAQLPKPEQVAAVRKDFKTAEISEKMRALLQIASEVQQSGRAVRPESVAAAKAHGASDVDLHDTVLIAAAFCMFNRYVDGLATVPAPNTEAYDQMAAGIVSGGYLAALSR